MHSYANSLPLVSTPLTATDQLQISDKMFALPAVQSVQGFIKILNE